MRYFLIPVGLLLLFFSSPTTSSPTAFAADTPFAVVQTCDSSPKDEYRQQITGMVDGDELTLTISARFGGAVESLTWRGKEFINIFDHGRQISYAWQMNGHGECFNPTEPGSASDLFSPSSTSELLEVCKLSENSLTTSVLPAFWLAPGEAGFCDGGAVTAVNETLVSDQVMDKRIEIGFAGIENVISFSIDINVPEEFDFLQAEIPTGYLTYEFDTYWRYDPVSGELLKAESEALIEPWSFVNTGKLPPILSTGDGEYAMGAYSPEAITAYEILWYDVPNPDDRTNKWNIVLHEAPVPAGVYSYDSYVVVGTLEQVVAGMQQLFDVLPTDFAPPEGYIDLASCEMIDGWAWDPKTPNEPIEVEFRRINDDGTQTVLTRVTADVFRPDLETALGDNGRHGFSIPAGEVLRDGSRQNIRVYGLNSNPGLEPRALIPANNFLECPEFEPTATPLPTELPASTPTMTESEIEPTIQAEEEGGGGALPCVGNALPFAAGLAFLALERRKARRKWRLPPES